MRAETIKKLEALLNERDAEQISMDGDHVHAAVMIILKYDDDGFSMLFIKRPDNANDPFSGHIAFPGGKLREEDGTKLDAAIRETLEEVGVNIQAAGRVLGSLDDVNPNNPRAANIIVTPYVSFLPEDVELRPCEYEVEAALWIPVTHLTDENNFLIRLREREGRKKEDYVYSYGKYIIWGMTGRILRQFLELSSGLF